MNNEQNMKETPKIKGTAVVTFTEYFSQLALLNLLWVLSAVLIFPIFAGTEAVFHCVSKMGDKEIVSLSSTFYQYVKENLWQSVKRVLLYFILFAILMMDGLIVLSMPETSVWRSLLMGSLIIVSLLLFYLFFYHQTYFFSTGHPLKNRLLLSLYSIFRYPHYTLGITLLLIGQLALSLYFIPLFFFFSLSFPAFYFKVFGDKIVKKIDLSIM